MVIWKKTFFVIALFLFSANNVFACIGPKPPTLYLDNLDGSVLSKDVSFYIGSSVPSTPFKCEYKIESPKHLYQNNISYLKGVEKMSIKVGDKNIPLIFHISVDFNDSCDFPGLDKNQAIYFVDIVGSFTNYFSTENEDSLSRIYKKMDGQEADIYIDNILVSKHHLIYSPPYGPCGLVVSEWNNIKFTLILVFVVLLVISGIFVFRKKIYKRNTSY